MRFVYRGGVYPGGTHRGGAEHDLELWLGRPDATGGDLAEALALRPAFASMAETSASRRP
jgi:hypothetical protein